MKVLLESRSHQFGSSVEDFYTVLPCQSEFQVTICWYIVHTAYSVWHLVADSSSDKEVRTYFDCLRFRELSPTYGLQLLCRHDRHGNLRVRAKECIANGRIPASMTSQTWYTCRTASISNGICVNIDLYVLLRLDRNAVCQSKDRTGRHSVGVKSLLTRPDAKS